MLNTQPQLRLSFAADTDVGRARQGKPNQDSLGIYKDFVSDTAVLATKGKLFVVADGMGGAAGGKEASSMAVDVVFRSFYDDPDVQLETSLHRAIEEANMQVQQQGRTNPELRGLGTTIVLALIHEQTLIMGNVGDSRGYLLHQDQLVQVSLDHTTVQDQVREGILTPEEALTHPRRHVLSRNLGYRPRAQPDFDTRTLVAGDTLLLCSDGLWGSVEDDELEAVLRQARGEDAVDMLIDLANERGGPDNISAVVIHVEGERPLVGGGTTEPVEQSSVTTEVPDNTTRAFVTTAPNAPVVPPQPAIVSAQPQSARVPVYQRLMWPLAAVGTILLLLGGTFIWQGTSRSSGATASQGAPPVAALPAAAGSAKVAELAVTSTPVLALAATPAPQLSQTLTVAPSLAATQATAVQTPSASVSTPQKTLAIKQDSSVSSAALAPNGRILAMGALDGTISLWRLPGGRFIMRFTADVQGIESLAFSPDGRLLASASLGETVKLWSFSADSAAAPLEVALPSPLDVQLQTATSGPRPRVFGVDFTQDNMIRVATEHNRNLVLWQVDAREPTLKTLQKAEDVRSVVFAADGQTFASLNQDQTVNIRRTSDASIIQTLPERNTRVTDVTFSLDGHTLVVVQVGGTVECWPISLADAAPPAIGTTGIVAPQQAATACDETNPAASTATTDPTQQVVITPMFATEPTQSVGSATLTTNPIQQGVITSTLTSEAIPQSEPTHTPVSSDGGPIRVLSLAFSPNGQQLVAVNREGVIKLWRVTTAPSALPSSTKP